jgi:hypothetical protein
MKVILILEGGIIQQVLADVEGLEVTIHDYDTDGYQEDELYIDLNGDEYLKIESFVEIYPEFFLGDSQ